MPVVAAILASFLVIILVTTLLLIVIVTLLRQLRELSDLTATSFPQQSLELVAASMNDAVRSVGDAVAASVAAAFAPTPVDTSVGAPVAAPYQAGAPTPPPRSVPYASDIDDSFDPTDNDPHLGIDAFLRDSRTTLPYNEDDPTGLGLSQDPANFGGR